ncbi:tyrosine-type recombinase/integrase [Agrobacterium tumefaciens]
MARPINKFSAKAVEALKRPGRHSDGGGLYLKVLPDGRRQWVFMYRWHGKQKEMGLGAFLPADAPKGVKYDFVSLADARQKAIEARSAIAQNLDPMAARRKSTAIPTFGEFADDLIEQIADGFKNSKHLAQWKMTLGDTYCKAIRKKRVDDIDTDDVLGVLQPIWQNKAETASRLRGRIERVLDAATAKGFRSGVNPALWRGHLANLLPKRRKLTRGHHKAMHHDQLPQFMRSLKDSDATSARALEFLILTACRSGEVLGAQWSEFDLISKVWTIPAERMKAGVEHRVPLSDAALNIIQRLHNERVNDYVFPGHKLKRPLSGMSMTMLMRRLELGQFTVHGFRSAFRDWAGDKTTFPRELAEAALAHRVGDETERAYRRGDALAKRRKLTDAWAKYCVSLSS